MHIIKPSNYDLDDEQYEHYHSLETTNDKNNFCSKNLNINLKREETQKNKLYRLSEDF